MGDKNLQLERTVFFCDAVVAIAITLLALDIKVEKTSTDHLQLSDITSQWKSFAAFLLSFINIANYWKTHHTFFTHIKKIDEKLLWLNIFWLFFIVLLPFSTSLVSGYFFDKISIILYSTNLLMVSIFQNNIWDYSTTLGFIKQDGEEVLTLSHVPIRLYCNLDMINAIIAIVLSFYSPGLAFILLFTKLPMIVLARLYFLPKKIKLAKNRRGGF
ncbi:TMEM175 family protein [Salmonirosea aquatica]|uniref:DUF1211 domain-containing protein n=1 Tax=Salmonirosea aquatica TaxID=2654236 RepID=A0A7C9FZE2_9BACT|nr:DUF1211 domain-containing protein [Cytophagaceae bacterium SJW1-29]